MRGDVGPGSPAYVPYLYPLNCSGLVLDRTLPMYDGLILGQPDFLAYLLVQAVPSSRGVVLDTWLFESPQSDTVVYQGLVSS